MARGDTLFDALKDLVVAAIPGLVTKADLRQLEERLAELEGLLDRLEEEVAKKED